ncbi:MAG: serine/threonine protein kinase [Gammaproteobacteria bacterium]|jgi:serine/threonine protein kinase
MGMEKHRNSLQPGYKLHWYHIIKILGQGGFGITYLAHDTNLDQQVAIKEYLPNDLAVRDQDISVHPLSEGHKESYQWGLERFISEARTLAKFKHPNIVRVLSVFTENNTAYMVMEYEHGEPMDALLKNRQTIAEEKLKSILMPMLDGLEEVHKEGFIHRDIKPPNIYIRTDGSPVLLDFGSARQSLGIQTKTLTSMVSPGYAPFEQYTSKSDKQGPWTDIYGLGATLYRAVTGIGPTDAMDRSEAIIHTNKDVYVPASQIAQDNYSADFLAAIDHALLFKTEARPQSIGEWRTEIESGVANSPIPSVTNILPDTDQETVAIPQETEQDIDLASEEKTVSLDKQNHDVENNKKPRSLLGRLIKWAAIIFVILLVLAIVGKNKKQNSAIESESTSSVPTDTVKESLGATSTSDESPSVIEDSPDVKSDSQIVDDLLIGARSNIQELKLTSPLGNNAYEKYQTVLNLDPQNPEALNGLDSIVDEYINLMDFALGKDDIPRARNYLDKGKRVNLNHDGLADAEKRYNAAVDADRQAQIKQDRPLVANSDKRRLEQLKEQLRANPRDKTIRKELRKIADKYQKNIESAIKEKEYDLAEVYVLEIMEITPEKSKARNELTDLLGKIRTLKNK